MSETSLFKESPLTDRLHRDPSKHYFGEALQPPSLGDVRYSGTETGTGVSPLPARADHSHDFRTRWSGLRSSVTATGKSVAAGATVFINDLIHVWGPDNLLNPGSNQLIDFPLEGVWQINQRIVISRSSGVFPADIFYQLVYRFNNATASHFMELGNYPKDRSQIHLVTTDVAYYSSVSAISNMQIEFTNGDAVAVNFRTYQLDIRRISSFQGTGEL